MQTADPAKAYCPLVQVVCVLDVVNEHALPAGHSVHDAWAPVE